MVTRIILMSILFFCSLSFSQVVKPEDREYVTLCWQTNLGGDAKYLIYIHRYNNPDTSWRLIGTTSDKTFQVAKQAFKGDIAFGVRTIYFNDTSAIHKSLDATACFSSANNTCDENCNEGPWYLSWHIKKPTHIGTIDQ